MHKDTIGLALDADEELAAALGQNNERFAISNTDLLDASNSRFSVARFQNGDSTLDDVMEQYKGPSLVSNIDVVTAH